MSYTYVDLDLDFTPNPVTGDAPLRTDEDAVKRSIRNLLLYGKYEKPFLPGFHSRLARLLFEPSTPLTAIAIRSNIISMIQQYEPRATVLDVTVDIGHDQNRVEATIVFRLVRSQRISTLKVSLERTR